MSLMLSAGKRKSVETQAMWLYLRKVMPEKPHIFETYNVWGISSIANCVVFLPFRDKKFVKHIKWYLTQDKGGRWTIDLCVKLPTNLVKVRFIRSNVGFTAIDESLEQRELRKRQPATVNPVFPPATFQRCLSHLSCAPLLWWLHSLLQLSLHVLLELLTEEDHAATSSSIFRTGTSAGWRECPVEEGVWASAESYTGTTRWDSGSYVVNFSDEQLSIRKMYIIVSPARFSGGDI